MWRRSVPYILNARTPRSPGTFVEGYSTARKRPASCFVLAALLLLSPSLRARQDRAIWLRALKLWEQVPLSAATRSIVFNHTYIPRPLHLVCFSLPLLSGEHWALFMQRSLSGLREVRWPRLTILHSSHAALSSSTRPALHHELTAKQANKSRPIERTKEPRFAALSVRCHRSLH